MYTSTETPHPHVNIGFGNMHVPAHFLANKSTKDLNSTSY